VQVVVLVVKQMVMVPAVVVVLEGDIIGEIAEVLGLRIKVEAVGAVDTVIPTRMIVMEQTEEMEAQA
jgi:hypothetical protein